MSWVFKLLRTIRNIATGVVILGLALISILALLVVLEPFPGLELRSTPEGLDAVFGFLWGLLLLLNLDRIPRMMPPRRD
jgi:hypothetical protein